MKFQFRISEWCQIILLSNWRQKLSTEGAQKSSLKQKKIVNKLAKIDAIIFPLELFQ